jgi:ribose transport system permease protein
LDPQRGKGGNHFLGPANIQLVASQTAVTAVAAIGMTLVIISGGIDLSVGSVIALVTVVAALALNQGCNGLSVLVLCIAAGALCGSLNGILITTLRIVPFIVTLGMLGAARGLAKWLPDLFRYHGGTVPLDRSVEAPAWLLNLLGRTEFQWLGLSLGLCLMITLSLFFIAVLRWSVLGRHIFAIGSNESTARLCGIRVGLTKVIVYTICGALVGISGLLQFSRIRVGDPTTALGQELDVIAAVVIGGGSLSGGSGSVSGTLAGAFLIQFLRAGCRSQLWPTATQEIIIGVIIVAAAAIDRMRHRRED